MPSLIQLSGKQKRKRAEKRKKKDKQEMKKIRLMDLFVVKTKPAENEIKLLLSELVKQVEKNLASVQELPETSQSIEPESLSQWQDNETDNFADLQTYSNDPALWPAVDRNLQTYWVKRNGPNQNISHKLSFKDTKQVIGNRPFFLTKSAFHRSLRNQESVSRRWLIYSESTYSVMCFVCKLFCKTNTHSYSNWSNLSRDLLAHESSQAHLQSVMVYAKCRKTHGVDVTLSDQIENEAKYWQNILQRVVETIRFLTVRALPLRGDNEITGSTKNGNFLGIMELLGKFDPFIAEHLKKFGNPGRGNVSYLSSTTVEEIIRLMADKVLISIIKELNEAKYFSISVDSTPDISHVDQLTFIARYLTSYGTPVERFICFVPVTDHHGEELASTVLNCLENLPEKIDIADCRGQCYDNAPNMSGRLNGLQSHIKKINPLAKFSPCTGHSLNLIGESAAKTCPKASKYFRHVQKIYNFFSASPARWAVLKNSLALSSTSAKVVKSLSETRWAARTDAVSALTEQLHFIQAALFTISTNSVLDMDVRNEAKSLLKRTTTKDFCLLCSIWNRILKRFDAVSSSLQQSDLSLDQAVVLLTSLHTFINSLRPEFNQFQTEAELLMAFKDKNFITAEQETRNSSKDSFCEQNFSELLDKLSSELQKRLYAYNEVRETFGVLVRFPHLSADEIRRQSAMMISEYSQDINPEISDELISLKGIVPTDLKMAIHIYCWMLELDIFSSFPNIWVAFRVFLSMMPTNCTGERSFSKLKLIKNTLRSTMGQTRLSSLALLSIESEITNSLDFSEIVKSFSAKKSRKKMIQ